MTASLYRERTHLEQDLRRHEKDRDRIYARDEYAEKYKRRFFDDALEIEMRYYHLNHVLSANEVITGDKMECEDLQSDFRNFWLVNVYKKMSYHIEKAARAAAEQRAFQMACDEFDEK